jgi:hypothetical protein
MKKIIVCSLLMLVGCLDATQNSLNRLECSWNDRYKICLCYKALPYNSAVLTYVPDRVCGK